MNTIRNHRTNHIARIELSNTNEAAAAVALIVRPELASPLYDITPELEEHGRYEIPGHDAISGNATVVEMMR